eukprot:6892413-Pyramimonas_sp.AAC.1
MRSRASSRCSLSAVDHSAAPRSTLWIRLATAVHNSAAPATAASDCAAACAACEQIRYVRGILRAPRNFK